MNTDPDLSLANPTESATALGSERKPYIRPLDLRHGRIDMGHGSGGKAAAQLIDELFLAAFDNPWLRQGDDGARLALPGWHPTQGRLVMACDGHVVSPLFFPGGDLGSLAVHGTVNDVAMMGAQPLYLSASFIIEEGFALADLRTLRDPTRGGLATTLNEIARQSGVGMTLQEAAIPVRQQVNAACELLGLDPLYVANEGKLIAICAPAVADRLLAVMRAHPLGQEAARIGTVTADVHRFVQMETGFGGRRVLDWLSAEQLPRIC